MRRWLPPFRAELELYGSQWGDFAFFGPAQFLLSERAAEALQDEKISGLAGFEPVEIVKVRGPRPVPSYLHAEVSLGGAATDEAKSSITRAGEIACARCRSGGLEAIHGFTIEDGTWTREDIFVLRDLPGVLVATARFKDVVSRHRLTNIRFVATERYEWDARPTRGA